MSTPATPAPAPGSTKPRAVPLDRASVPRTSPLHKLSDFALGVRLALHGGGESMGRSLLTAAGVGLAVVVLLFGASVPHIISARDHRAQAQSVNWAGKSQPLTGILVTTYYRGREIDGLALHATGAHPAIPPGLKTLPKAGELVVSPAVKKMIDAPGGDRLQRLLGGRVVGVIGHSGLKGPGQLIYYLGASDLNLRVEAGPIAGFNASLPHDTQAEDVILMLLEIALAVGLLTPIGQFVVTASRFGSERRNERLASIRLFGASRSSTARIATGETLPGVLGGVLLGATLFLSLRPLVEHVELFGVTVFSSDVRPSPALTVAVVVMTPIVCVLSTVVAMRKTMSDPLGAVRQRTEAKRRLSWRIVILTLGFVLLAPLFMRLRSLYGTGAELEAAVGMVLVLLGVAALTPWVIEAVIGRAGNGGSPSWLLAVRTLRARQGTVGRVIAAVALTVAGAIALQILFTSANRSEAPSSNQAAVSGGVAIDDLVAGTPAAMARIDDRLAKIPGSSGVAVLSPSEVDLAGGRAIATIVVAPCATLEQFKAFRGCTSDSAYFTAGRGIRPGERLLTGGSNEFSMPSTEVVPRDARPIRDSRAFDVMLEAVSGYSTSRAALGKLVLAPDAARRLHMREFEVSAALDFATPPGTAMQLYNDVELIDPIARVEGTEPESDFQSRLAGLNNVLLAGALLVLLVVAASVLVATADQLRERRAAIAGLAAIGVKRSTLTLSLVWQIAAQLALGIAVAIVFGVTLGVALVRIEERPLAFDVGAILALAGAGIVLVFGVTLASLPFLARQMRPAALRTE